VKIFNLHGDDWTVEEREGWRSGAWVGARIGAELIGGACTARGRRSSLYHTHHANEEWLLVVRNAHAAHTGGEQDKEGDVVCFLRGKDGAPGE
jgi:uncharacterized cupin superfamily protein